VCIWDYAAELLKLASRRTGYPLPYYKTKKSNFREAFQACLATRYWGFFLQGFSGFCFQFPAWRASSGCLLIYFPYRYRL
jgi:hypothetical protein